MEPYAVIETGGKQYRVIAGTNVTVERLEASVGEQVELTSVLAVSDGKSLTVGAPLVDSAKVISEVVDHVRGDKVVSFKQKRRKGSKRKIGHRQNLTVLKVQSIG